MAKPKSNLEFGQEGLINAVEDEMKNLIEYGFNNNTSLGVMSKPSTIRKANPDETAEFADLPAMFIWVNNIIFDANLTGGQQTNDKKRNRMTFILEGSYRYIFPNIENQEDSERQKEYAWWLLDHISKNLDLNGSVSGNPSISSLDLFPKWALVGQEVKAVSNVDISVEYPITRKQKMSSNRR